MKKLAFLFIFLLTVTSSLLSQPRFDRYVASDYIPQGFAVAVNSSGYLVIADSLTNVNFVGVAFRAVDGLATADVVSSGLFTNSRWSFTVGKPVYLGANGNLQTGNQVGSPVGLAVSSTSVYLSSLASADKASRSPETFYTFFEDFDTDSLGLLNKRWTLTLDSATVSSRDSASGVMAVSTTGGGTFQRGVLQPKVESVKFRSGLPVTYGAHVFIDSALINAKVFIGLSVRTTTPGDSLNDADVTSGAFFYKAGGDTLFACRSVRGDTAGIGTDNYSNTRTTFEIPRLLGKGAWLKLLIEWDGSSTLTFKINGATVASVTSTNHVAITELIPILSIRNSSSGTHSLVIDYLYINQKRRL